MKQIVQHEGIYFVQSQDIVVFLNSVLFSKASKLKLKALF